MHSEVGDENKNPKIVGLCIPLAVAGFLAVVHQAKK
jgi:hypothetical protein